MNSTHHHYNHMNDSSHEHNHRHPAYQANFSTSQAAGSASTTDTNRSHPATRSQTTTMGFLERSRSTRARIYQILGYNDRSFAARSARDSDAADVARNKTTSRPRERTNQSQPSRQDSLKRVRHARSPDRAPEDSVSQRPPQHSLQRSKTSPQRVGNSRETIYVYYPEYHEDEQSFQQPYVGKSRAKDRQVIGKRGTIYNPFEEEDSDNEYKDDRLVTMTEVDGRHVQMIYDNKLNRSATIGHRPKISHRPHTTVSLEKVIGNSSPQPHSRHYEANNYYSEQPSLLHRRGAVRRPSNAVKTEQVATMQGPPSLVRRGAIRRPSNAVKAEENEAVRRIPSLVRRGPIRRPSNAVTAEEPQTNQQMPPLIHHGAVRKSSNVARFERPEPLEHTRSLHRQGTGRRPSR